MEVYFFFKKYYVALGRGIAIFLSKKGVTPNMASIVSLFITFPLFDALYSLVDLGIIFWILFFICLQIKLVLNAIDGIIARQQNISSQSGRYYNVISDILPDIYILGGLLIYIGHDFKYAVILMSIIFIYLLLECLYIYIHRSQNLYYGKECRVLFYILIFLGFYMQVDILYMITLYFIFLLIHNVGFIQRS